MWGKDQSMSVWTTRRLSEQAKADADNDNLQSTTLWRPGRYGAGTEARDKYDTLLIFITEPRTSARLSPSHCGEMVKFAQIRYRRRC